MPQIVNTNVLSLNAQKNLDRSSGTLATSLQRLSSGLRINSAKDDAAGLAIANRMSAQIRGANQAARNSSDAISLAQTGEGGLQELTNNLQRMRELAVQSRNATNTDNDRASLDAEFQQLLSEVDRVAQTTSFNGRNVLDGSLGTSVFQVGANVGETVSVNVSSSMRTNAIGAFASVTYNMNTVTDVSDTIANLVVDNLSIDNAGEINIDGTNVAAAANNANGRGDGSALSIAAAINASQGTHGVTATASATTATFTAAQIGNFSINDVTSGDTITYTVSLNGQTITTQTEGSETITTATQLASAINNESGTTGVTATVDSNNNLTLTAADGRNIEITENIAGATDAVDNVVGYFGNTVTGELGTTATAIRSTTYKADITLSSESSFVVTTDDDGGVSTFTQITDGSGGTDTTNANTINASSILTATDSDLAIQKIDVALREVDSLRGTFGAIQSRFESTIRNLQTTAENVSAARARIRDADFATETAELTRSQILQQAGISVLTQANSTPQLALSLLQ